MPTVIAYPTVLEQVQRQELRSLYHNSGAFGFARGAEVRHVGWIGPPDETIRPEARPLVQQMPEPYVTNLVNRLVQTWQDVLPGVIWFAPMSHWSFELDHGSKAWLPDSLREIGIDPTPLVPLNNALAIEFASSEIDPARTLATDLLENLAASDFAILFPDCPVLCTLHHHQQLWWTTTDPAVYQAISSQQ